MWKFIYELLVNPLGLPISPFLEYVIILLVGEVAHEIAYWISPGGKTFGSIVYWISKFITFLLMWAILYILIIIIQFIIAHWVWFASGLLLLIVGITITIIFKKKNKDKEIYQSKM